MPGPSVFPSGHQDVILSMSFNTNGSLLATACKDRKIRVLDPRAGTVLQVSASLGSSLGPEEQGVEWARGVQSSFHSIPILTLTWLLASKEPGGRQGLP